MNNFDFFAGSWDVVNRRLKERLVGSDDWDEFPGISDSTRHLDGRLNVDEIHFPTKGFSGFTLRTFDPRREEWSLYWVSSRDGILQPPVVGRFTDGRGEFFGDDEHHGKPIRVRYVWSDITPTSARWEQAFSVDGQRTWENNWIMECTRR